MEPLTYILGATLVAVTSGIVGKLIGSNSKVEEVTCSERRVACNKSIDERLNAIDKKLDILLAKYEN